MLTPPPPRSVGSLKSVPCCPFQIENTALYYFFQTLSLYSTPDATLERRDIAAPVVFPSFQTPSSLVPFFFMAPPLSSVSFWSFPTCFSFSVLCFDRLSPPSGVRIDRRISDLLDGVAPPVGDNKLVTYLSKQRHHGVGGRYCFDKHFNTYRLSLEAKGAGPSPDGDKTWDVLWE